MSEFFINFFKMKERDTSVKTEVIAGMTTFITMAYIIIVNPKILEAAGMPFEASMAATIYSAAIGTLIMGLYANRPFAIAPYMGENAFIAFTVVKVMGYSWQTALGAIFISGILFTILTLLRVRQWLAEAIPESLKISFAVGIGLFLAFIGLNETGIIHIGIPGAPVHIGDFRHPSVLIAIVTFLFMGILLMRRVPGAILIGIAFAAAASVMAGLMPAPARWISSPPDITPVFMKLDVRGALSWGMFSVVLTVFVMAFLDTIGTLIALGYKAGMLDQQGNMPDIEKPMLSDAVATTIAALLGTTTTGAYIESATGIAAGGRTGLSAIVTAILFGLALFLAPVLTIIPAHAYGPSLIIVGVLMMSAVGNLRWDDLSEAIPAFAVITLMCFTYNIGIGMTAGFIVYPLFKIFCGEAGKVKPGLWALMILSLLFYVFYHY
jgi:AGZA family xanthine/uracil permease-like MFS transporter